MADPAGEPGARKRQRRRLSRSAEFDRVYRQGRSQANRYLVLHAFPREREETGADEVRLGVSVGRKVGGAVQRSTVKRALREAFWGLAERLPDGYDFVIVGRPELGGLVEREGMEGAQAALEGVLDEVITGRQPAQGERFP